MQPRTLLTLLVSILYVTSSVLAHIPERAPSLEAVRDSNDLPSGYQQLLQYSPSDRQETYQKLDNETRAALWTCQFDSYIAKHPDLSPEKLALIQELADYVTFPGSNEDLMQNLEEKIKRTFDREEARSLFAQLSDDNSGVDHSNNGQHAHTRRQGRHSRCDCSIGSFWTCRGNPSGCTRWDCKIQETGCGFWGKYKCDGICEKGCWDGISNPEQPMCGDPDGFIA